MYILLKFILTPRYYRVVFLNKCIHVFEEIAKELSQIIFEICFHWRIWLF